MQLGRNIRTAREALGLSQDRLADRIGVTKATISAWENNHKAPEAWRLPGISQALEAGLDELFGLAGPPAGYERPRSAPHLVREPDAIDRLPRTARMALARFVELLAAESEKSHKDTG